MAVSETYAGNIIVVKGGDEFQAKASGALGEGRLVTLNTTVTDDITVSLAAENEAETLGYVDTDWGAGDRATVYTGGIARLEDSGSGISIGTRVMPAADGKIKTFASGTTGDIVGIALETIGANEFGKVLVNISHEEGR
jgi:predicted RecA/RadA family phage recombinase